MSFFETSYFVILPCSHGEFSAEWDSCFEQLLIMAGNANSGIFKINIFVSSADVEEYRFRKKLISECILETFVDDCPAFGVLPITPADQFKVIIEAGIVNLAGADIFYRRYNNLPYSVLKNKDYKELWANGVEAKTISEDTEKAARIAFELMYQILSVENLSFDNVIRQWNYIGEILDTRNSNSEIVRNYQLFNKVRFEYYRTYKKTNGYPAATGVGMNYKSVMIDFCAAEPNESMSILSIGNPQQRDPYDYDQVVLSDAIIPGKGEKHPPLFERAKLIGDKNNWRLFVSGTASIIGQETIAVGNVQEQTRITIENIRKLTSFENVRSHFPEVSYNDSAKFNYIRVYVKDISDVEKVRSICYDFFAGIPAVYIQSHICRTNLLVEIEAELNYGISKS